MSYDLSIGNEDFNYTYNVSQMWYDFYPDRGIREHYGMTGKDSLPILRYLRNHMEDNEASMREMEPDNGWGSYEGALEFVGELILAAIRNPDEIWDGD